MKNEHPRPRARLPVIILSVFGLIFYYIGFCSYFTPLYGNGYFMTAAFWFNVIGAVVAPALLFYVLVIYRIMSTRVGLIIRYGYVTLTGIFSLISFILSLTMIARTRNLQAMLGTAVNYLPNFLLLILAVVVLIRLIIRREIRPFVVAAFLVTLVSWIVTVIAYSVSLPAMFQDSGRGFTWLAASLGYIGYIGSLFSSVAFFVFVMANAPRKVEPPKPVIDKDSPITEYTISG